MKCQVKSCGYNLDGECYKRLDDVQPNSLECPHYIKMISIVALTRLRTGGRICLIQSKSV